MFDGVKFNRVKWVNKMTIKEIEYLKSGSYVYLYDRWLKLSYNDEYRIVYTNDPFFLSLGFKKSGDYYELYLSRESVYEFTAIRKYIYCIFCGGKYTPNEVVKNGKIILFPDIDTQIHILVFWDKGEHYIEISYDKFISEVTDVWEERTPIEGFKFDTEPVVYIKKDRVWLKEPKE